MSRAQLPDTLTDWRGTIPPEHPLRFVALDLAPAATGVATTHTPSGDPALAVHTVKPRGDGLHERVHDITLGVATACRMQPQLAILEGLYVGHNNNTLQLAGLHFHVRHWLWTSGIPYVQVSPKTRALYATGNGDAKKTTVLRAAQDTYIGHVYLRDDDQADAFVLLAMACDWYGAPIVELPPTHRRALRTPRWPVLKSPLRAGVDSGLRQPAEVYRGAAP